MYIFVLIVLLESAIILLKRKISLPLKKDDIISSRKIDQFKKLYTLFTNIIVSHNKSELINVAA